MVYRTQHEDYNWQGFVEKLENLCELSVSGTLMHNPIKNDIIDVLRKSNVLRKSSLLAEKKVEAVFKIICGEQQCLPSKAECGWYLTAVLRLLQIPPKGAFL